MYFQQKITLGLLLCVISGSAESVQHVDMPDPNLCAAIVDAPEIRQGAPITQAGMERLASFVIHNKTAPHNQARICSIHR